MFILVACSAALVVVAGARAGAVRSTLLSVAAGVYFALTAALAKLTMADLFGRGIPATARDWPGYALAAATVVGLVLEQGAFAAGRLPTAVTAMTITNPITGYVLAVGGFGEQLPSGVSDLVVVAMGAALITVGVATLSRCELLHGPAVQRRETSAVPSG
jgi:multisubunit Na+/H+ antiporter MnhG subunit